MSSQEYSDFINNTAWYKLIFLILTVVIPPITIYFAVMFYLEGELKHKVVSMQTYQRIHKSKGWRVTGWLPQQDMVLIEKRFW